MEPIKLKKRHWIFRWLRKKIGLDSLALEFYKTRAKFNDFKAKAENLSCQKERQEELKKELEEPKQ